MQQVADDLNAISAFLARRGIPSPDRANADVTVLLGNSLLASIQTAVESNAPLLVCSGGVGHSTENLRGNVLDHFGIETEGGSEAEIMAAVAIRLGHPRDRILFENQSTNTGENVAFTRRLLEERGIDPMRILIVQDPTMQLRSHATFQRVWADRPEVVLISYAPFVPQVNSELRLVNDVPGLWPFDRFVSLLLGEIPRLRDYGPFGRGFIAHVEVPAAIDEAYNRLRDRFPSLRNR